MFNSVKWIAIAAVVGAVGLAGWYVTGLRADLATARANVAVLEEAVATNEAAIEQLRQDFELNAAAINRVNSVVASTGRELAQLRDRFAVSPTTERPRDVGSIARQRPESVERLVNRGTAFALRCVELASGSPHTPEELAALLPSEVNNICPELANPNRRP